MATGNSRQRPFRVRKSYVLTDAEQRGFLSRQCEALAREQPGIKTVRDRLTIAPEMRSFITGYMKKVAK